MNIYFMGLILHMYTQSIIGSDHEWKVEVPHVLVSQCSGATSLLRNKMNHALDQVYIYRAIHMDKYYFVVSL